MSPPWSHPAPARTAGAAEAPAALSRAALRAGRRDRRRLAEVIDPSSSSEDLPELTDPVVVAAFEGWNDAGDAATGAVEHLEQVWDAKPLAAIDPEDYYDFQVNRPTVSLVDGVSRRIEWPTTRISVARPPGSERDVVLIRGIEPNMRWRGVLRGAARACRRARTSRWSSRWARCWPTRPHTRPTPVTGTAYDAESARRSAWSTSRYEGPTGIVGVLPGRVRRRPGCRPCRSGPRCRTTCRSRRARRRRSRCCSRVEEVLDLPVPLGDLPAAGRRVGARRSTSWPPRTTR